MVTYKIFHNIGGKLALFLGNDVKGACYFF